MKIAGIIGGVSWHSTKLLYEYVNTRVAQEKGGLNCARMVMINVNLQEIVQAGNSKEKENIIVDAALRAERAGAEFITLCSNGLHQYAQCIENAVNIPFIHIADVTADAIVSAGYQRVGLLGVKETMEQDFYKARLEKRGLQISIPEKKERDFIEKVLFNETGIGIVKKSSQEAFGQIIQKLVEQSRVQSVILGCTEIEMLVKNYKNVPLFNTTTIYADRIAQLCCED